MKRIQIGNTDVILEDYEIGKGKIIISDTEGYNFSYYWGAMGCSISEFLLGLDECYFSMKLKPIDDNGVLDAKLSVRQIRRMIKEDYSYELPWYKYMDFQKELREKLKEIETQSYGEDDFVRRCMEIPKSYWSSLDYEAEKEFVKIIESLFDEPWHYIVKGDSKNTKFLKNLLPKLQKKLAVKTEVEKQKCAC